MKPVFFFSLEAFTFVMNKTMFSCIDTVLHNENFTPKTTSLFYNKCLKLNHIMEQISILGLRWNLASIYNSFVWAMCSNVWTTVENRYSLLRGPAEVWECLEITLWFYFFLIGGDLIMYRITTYQAVVWTTLALFAYVSRYFRVDFLKDIRLNVFCILRVVDILWN